MLINKQTLINNYYKIKEILSFSKINYILFYNWKYLNDVIIK